MWLYSSHGWNVPTAAEYDLFIDDDDDDGGDAASRRQ